MQKKIYTFFQKVTKGAKKDNLKKYGTNKIQGQTTFNSGKKWIDITY